jgi:hypothetical protein
MKRALLLGWLLVASGCHRRPPVTYFDFCAHTDVPDGVGPGLVDLKGQILLGWGAFSGSSIVIAYDQKIPDTVYISWAEGVTKDYRQLLDFRSILPPIDPRRQKYNAQFWFHPGGKVDVKVDTMSIDDCSDTHDPGPMKTNVPQYGPCSVTGKW